MPQRLLTATLLALLLGLFAREATAAVPPHIVGARIGLGGQYKLGCWTPIRVQVEGGTEPLGVSVIAIAPDSDAIGVATTTPGGRPLSTEPRRTSQSLLYTRIGKDNAPIELRLMLGNKVVDRRVVQGGAYPDPRFEIATTTPATHHLTLAITDTTGLAGAITDAKDGNNDGYDHPTLGVAKVASLADLPPDAIGYDSFDVVLLVAGRSGWLSGLTAGDPRLVALEQWVRDGGRLVLSCGTAGAELLIDGGPLAGLVPGRFASLESLPRTEAIERYSEATKAKTPIDLEGGVLTVSRLEDVTGPIEAHDGRVAKNFPLVVRSPLGFGEVTFVAFDLDAPALAPWSGRSALMARLLDLPRKEADDSPRGMYYGGGATGFVGTLIHRLDNSFIGVRTTPFLAVVGLVIGYLLLIGPGDYFFVKRVIGRMEATWITFPLLVLLTSAAAYSAAYWLKGSELRVNQIEVIDIDSTGEGVVSPLRGTLVTHLFSPRADRYNLSLSARAPNGEDLATPGHQIAWLGKPGYGLGGMQTALPQRLGWRPDYVLDPTPHLSAAEAIPLRALPVRGLPVQVWSTKTLLSRWTSTTDRSIEAALTPTGDGLAEGTLTNDTGTKLTDCRLLYGDWSWRLGTLGDGETTVVDESVSPLRLQTLLRGTIKKGENYNDFHNRHLSIEQLMPLLSISTDKIDGTMKQRTNLSHCNLSPHLAAGRAILLARCESENPSELLRDGVSLSEEHPEMSKNWVFCRYVLKVE